MNIQKCLKPATSIVILSTLVRTIGTTASLFNQAPKAPVKKKVKGGAAMEKKRLPVEKDPEILLKYVCGSNILKEGEDVRIGPDSDYPDWLWTLRLDPKPLSLDQLDPDTKQYWRRIRTLALRRNNQLRAARKIK